MRVENESVELKERVNTAKRLAVLLSNFARYSTSNEG